VLAWLLVLTAPATDEGYTYPPERRGDVVATFTVHVPEGTGPARVDYTLTVEGGPALEVESPQLEDSAGAWSSRRSSAWALDNGRVRWTEEIELEQVKPGLVPLPDVKLNFRDGPSGPWEEAQWLNVLKDIQELPGPEPPPAPQPGRAVARWLWPLAGAGAVLLILTVALLRRRKVEAPLSPDARVLRELDRLEQSSGQGVLRADPEWRVLFARLSDVLRRYLAERFGLPAFQQTTAEFLRAVQQEEPLNTEKDYLREVLELCDLAKFAGIRGDEGVWTRAVEQARAFVRRTAPLPSATDIRAAQKVRNGYSCEHDPDAHSETK
jgi:hypothetical protein